MAVWLSVPPRRFLRANPPAPVAHPFLRMDWPTSPARARPLGTVSLALLACDELPGKEQLLTSAFRWPLSGVAKKKPHHRKPPIRISPKKRSPRIDSDLGPGRAEGPQEWLQKLARQSYKGERAWEVEEFNREEAMQSLDNLAVNLEVCATGWVGGRAR